MEPENDYKESYCHLHDGRIEYVRGGQKASLMVYRIFDDNDEDAPEWVQVAWATGRLRVKSSSRFLVSTMQGHLRTGIWGDYIVFDPNNWALSVCPVELARSFGLVSGKEGE